MHKADINKSYNFILFYNIYNCQTNVFFTLIPIIHLNEQ